jgi:hypothetical protein
MALFFAKRNRLHVPGITLGNAVSVVEAAVRALQPYDQRKKNWSDQLIRWNRKHGLPQLRKRRPTFVDSWLAKLGLTSGDVVSIPRANLLRTELNVNWRRYHTRAATPNQMLWRHRPLAEVALMMTWRDDRTVEVNTVRVIHRKHRAATSGVCQELCQSGPRPRQSVPGLQKTSKRTRRHRQGRIAYEDSKKSQRRRKKE